MIERMFDSRGAAALLDCADPAWGLERPWEDAEDWWDPADPAGVPDPGVGVTLPAVDPLDEVARFGRAVAMMQGAQLQVIAEFVAAEVAGRGSLTEEQAFKSAAAQVSVVLGVATGTGET